ncbi:helix-turn-helix domain-containing protein [Herbiconiux sp. CPCC 205763]|uniref:Helix-turn-helix domain-containing protein n=1 Tax=Herbiconiux aconitum TaxID=2970913 RepID=A0ABT2GPI2_9MICO|nr:helix-turn-helix domain-containing protein [Herbiconiux aconitum]MCS5718134.1 helix-turn-helix domain-containing protein [Herbiconiux aconitum]
MTDVQPRTRSATVLGEYLWARRSLIQPESVGLTREPNRRVPGLRREEVAKRASISAEYYLRLEQGHEREPSDHVLRGIARALLLDEGAEQHLLRLRRRHPSSAANPASVPADLSRLLERWTRIPAFVMSGNLELLLVNGPAATIGDRRFRPGFNLVESHFSAARDDGWEALAAQYTAALRYHGDPYDHRFQQLVGRLSARDRDFRRIWARHDAHPYPSGRMRVEEGTAETAYASFHVFEVPAREGILVTVLGEESSQKTV